MKVPDPHNDPTHKDLDLMRWTDGLDPNNGSRKGFAFDSLIIIYIREGALKKDYVPAMIVTLLDRR